MHALEAVERLAPKGRELPQPLVMTIAGAEIKPKLNLAPA